MAASMHASLMLAAEGQALCVCMCVWFVCVCVCVFVFVLPQCKATTFQASLLRLPLTLEKVKERKMYAGDEGHSHNYKIYKNNELLWYQEL
jgi:hypothetical protein